MQFHDKVAVVTGAAMGIGQATAVALAAEGAKVAVLDIDEDAGRAVAAPLGERGAFVHCDVASGESISSSFDQVLGRFGGVDILINNAGIQHYGTVTQTTEQEWDRVMAINLRSAFLCARAAIPSMQERGGGVIVNLASVQAFVSQNNVAPYTTSKTALLGLTRSIAVDYAPRIRCVAVCPGTVDTPMLRNAIQQSPHPAAVLQECIDMHPVKRICTPEEVAALIVFLCSDNAAFMTGQYYRIDGGLGLSIGGSKRE